MSLTNLANMELPKIDDAAQGDPFDFEQVSKSKEIDASVDQMMTEM